MSKSLEIRWFIQGAVPQSAREWLQDIASGLATQQDRADFYLGMPGHGDVGVKFRGGKLEIKMLERRGASLALSPRCTGVPESWAKCGYDIADADGVEQVLSGELACWIRVRKQRTKCVLDPNGKAVGKGTILTNGHCLEVTELEARGQSWCTLAFEGFGPMAEDASVLLDVGNALFAELPFAGLGVGASFGYPEWLQRLPS
jgi:hypothetical protein